MSILQKCKSTLAKFSSLQLWKKIAVLVSCIVVLVALLAFVFQGSGQTNIDVQTALKEIVMTSNLSTTEYTYNSIAEIANEKETECYISYSGTVKMGVDIEKIKIESKRNTYYVIVPEIGITNISVEKKLDFLFTKKKYEKEGIFETAHKACYNDLKSKAECNTAMQKLTIENAIQTVEALTAPLAKALPSGKSIEVVYIDEWEEENS